MNDQGDITQRKIYFAYGAMCNSVSRRRRKIQESFVRPAYLPNFRIDFSLAGVANIIPVSEKNNEVVHGVLMEFDSQEMWEKVCQSEIGYAAKQELVIPYNNEGKYENSSNKESDTKKKVLAHVFYMSGTQDKSSREENHAKEDQKTGKKEDSDEKVGKPQERYLKVIAEGMRSCGVDESYITNSILGVDCYPSRKPSNYLTFQTNDAEKLPKLTFEEYQKRSTHIPCFLIGNRIIDLDDKQLPNDDHPLVKFLRAKAIGKSDFTSHLLEVLYDPDLPDQSQHGQWAEDQCVDIFMGSNMYELGHVNYNLK